MRLSCIVFIFLLISAIFVLLVECHKPHSEHKHTAKLLPNVQLDGVRFVHLALTGNSSEMMVSYYTDHKAKESLVKWGVQSKTYLYQAKGTALSWKEGYGYSHNVKIDNLNPNTKYYYICGDDSVGWSSEYSFTTKSEETKYFRLAVYGDMGIDNSQNTISRVIEKAQQDFYDWIFHIGDIGYADDHAFTFQQTWNTWFSMVEPITPYFPYMVLPGNHEYCSLDPLLYFDTKDFVVFNQRFEMPLNPVSKNSNMYYSFDYGLAHFVVYSTETSFPGAPFPIFEGEDYGDQMEWLKNDLIQANKNRKSRPWIIASAHRPIYSSISGYSYNGIPANDCAVCTCAILQKIFEDLFNEQKVDLIINAHVHSYERNYPTYKNKRTGDYNNPSSPVHIVIGDAGNIEGIDADWTPQPEWSAYRFSDDYGYAELTIFNETHLNWKFYSSSDGILRDEFSLIQQNH